ncbi:hypothetical protein [Marmoricola sp. RAF53]|uniref:hypothetical protein n=1 Tax=Marmoricola sp. RAF53 TaxID=3233059 RepID=UPI003F954E34
MDTVIWVLLAVIVAVFVIAGLVALSRAATTRKQDRDRARAAELREEAGTHQTTIRRHQAEADAAEARAREVRAEADRKDAESRKLEADYEERRTTLTEHVKERDEALRRADELDPDVDDAPAP